MTGMFNIFLVATAFSFITDSTSVDSQNVTDWISLRVIPKLGVKLQFENEELARRAFISPSTGEKIWFWVYRVERIENTKVWLSAEHGCFGGWVSPSDLIVLEGADAYFTDAIHNRTNLAKAYEGRGFLNLIFNRLDRAIDDSNHAIELEPDNSSAFSLRGFARFREQNFAKAISDFSEAIRINPTDPTGYLQRGRARINNREIDNGMSDFSEALRLDPMRAGIYIIQGTTRQSIGDYSGAKSDFEQAVHLDSRNPWAFASRGRLNLHLGGDLDSTIADMNTSIGIDQKFHRF